MHAGALLHQFCPRDKHKQFTLPWNVKTIVVKIQAMTRTAPLYTVRWKSQVVRQKLQSLTPAPNVVSGSCRFIFTWYNFIILIIRVLFETMSFRAVMKLLN